MKTQLKHFPILWLVIGFMMSPIAGSAQPGPGDGDCPMCFADPENLEYGWCDTWIVGGDWCASVAGVCVSESDPEDLCQPEMALLTVDGADFTEHQVDWSNFPFLNGIGEELGPLVADGRAHLLGCERTVLLRAYTQQVQASLRTDVSALVL